MILDFCPARPSIDRPLCIALKSLGRDSDRIIEVLFDRLSFVGPKFSFRRARRDLGGWRENCWRGRWILFVSRNDRVARLLEQFSLFTSIVPRASGEKEKRRIPDDPSGHRGRAKVVYLERNSRSFVNFANKEPRSRTRIMAGRCMSFPSLTMLLGQYRCHFARVNSVDSELSLATVLLGARTRGILREYSHFTRRYWCGF